MDKPISTPNIGKLRLSDDAEEEDVEDLFASPESGATTQKHTPSSQSSSAQKQTQQPSHPRPRQTQNQDEARTSLLLSELNHLREVNRAIESVTSSLTKAKDSMDTVNRTVNNASTLLATWTRILSQTEHNQRLILNPNWQGAGRDVEDLEHEERRRELEVERRMAEEQRRREEGQRRAEEEERRRLVAAESKAQSGRGFGGRTRSTRGGYVGVGGQTGRGRGASVGSSRGGTGSGSGIGRAPSTRGRGRGVG